MTTVVYYDEIALGRWIEEAMRKAGITVVLGAVLRGVNVRRPPRQGARSRHALWRHAISATGFVDATGDAALTWHAGLPAASRQSRQVFGTQMVVLENIDEANHPERDEMTAAHEGKGRRIQLVRRDAVSLRHSRPRHRRAQHDAHRHAARAAGGGARASSRARRRPTARCSSSRSEFPECFGNARVRAYGNPGIRQTRWIVGRHQLTIDEVRNGTKFDDAVARTAWPVELHDHSKGYVWQTFPEDHVHYIPLGSLTPADADNIVAAGRCIDADLAALSSVRVMGPCIAMGAAAAHALDLAGSGSVHQIDIAAMKKRVHDNLERNDPQKKAELTDEEKRHFAEAHR